MKIFATRAMILALLISVSVLDVQAFPGRGGGGGGGGGGFGGGGGGGRGGFTAPARSGPTGGGAGGNRPSGGGGGIGTGGYGGARPGAGAGGPGRPGAGAGGIGGPGRPGAGAGGIGGPGRPGAGAGGIGGPGRPGAGVGGIGGPGRPGAGVGGVGRPGVGVGGIGIRGGVVVVGGGTAFRPVGAMHVQGGAVCNHWHQFAHQYPGLAVRWRGPIYWPVAWATLSGYGGYSSAPIYYDYGTTTVYNGDSVYVNGDSVGTQEEYANQATEIAAVAQAAPPMPAEELQYLGVFGLVQGEETTANQIIQLALNKNGIISGEYYNAATDATEKLSGAVDKNTQRAAWTVGDRKTTVYEVGIANLTKDETTMLIHYGKDKTQQWTLVRLPEPTSAVASADSK
jgi:hypothetical protein